jgi:hypothetical protein
MLDYSGSALPTLNKSNLNESTGIGGPSTDLAKHECVDRSSPTGYSNSVAASAAGPIDWNCSLVIDPYLPLSPISYDINGDSTSGPSTLHGYDDWDNLNFLVGTIGLGASGSDTQESQGPPPDTSTIDVDPNAPGGVDSIDTVATPEQNSTTPQVTPLVTWNTPAAITYGTALSSSQLNASTGVDGTYSYSPSSGTVLGAGTQTLSVTFTPTDTADYTTASGSVPLTVNKANTTVTATGTNITYGQTSVSLSATVSAASPSTATVNEGSVTFQLQQNGANVGSSVTANVSNGSAAATYTLPAGAVGAYTINATYNPATSSPNFNGGTGTGTVSVLYVAATTNGTQNYCNGDLEHTILQPVNTDGSSVFKAGSTVPLKFRVCDINGKSVGTTGVVTSFVLTKTVSGTGAVNETTTPTTGDTAFRWDSTNQQWIYNLSTKGMAAGYTYYYSVNLNDGTAVSFSFGLR